VQLLRGTAPDISSMMAYQSSKILILWLFAGLSGILTTSATNSNPSEGAHGVQFYDTISMTEATATANPLDTDAEAPSVVLCTNQKGICISLTLPKGKTPCLNTRDNQYLKNSTITAVKFSREFSGCHFYSTSNCATDWIIIVGSSPHRGKEIDFNAPGSLHPGGINATSLVCYGP
jgi:hypothetical protein